MQPRSLRALGVVLSLLPLTGCAGWVRGDIGVAASTNMRAGRQGASLNADAALGLGASPILLDIGVHGKIASATGVAAVSAGLAHIGMFGPVGWYGIGSLSMVEVGTTDAKVSFGMFGPSAEAGLVFAPSLLSVRPLMLTLGARCEYDLRFTSQPSEGFWSVTLGAAFGRVK